MNILKSLVKYLHWTCETVDCVGEKQLLHQLNWNVPLLFLLVL